MKIWKGGIWIVGAQLFFTRDLQKWIHVFLSDQKEEAVKLLASLKA
jgi:hypothetical protein